MLTFVCSKYPSLAVGSQAVGEKQGLVMRVSHESSFTLGGSSVWLGGKLCRVFGSAKCHQTLYYYLLG